MAIDKSRKDDVHVVSFDELRKKLYIKYWALKDVYMKASNKKDDQANSQNNTKDSRLKRLSGEELGKLTPKKQLGGLSCASISPTAQMRER